MWGGGGSGWGGQGGCGRKIEVFGKIYKKRNLRGGGREGGVTKNKSGGVEGFAKKFGGGGREGGVVRRGGRVGGGVRVDVNAMLGVGV